MKKIVLGKNDSNALKEFHGRVDKLLGNGLRKMVLFGSKAQGRASAESDIDVLVLVDHSSSKKRDDILDEAFEVNLKYGVYISPRIIPLSTYNHPVWKITAFLKHIRKEGIAL